MTYWTKDQEKNAPWLSRVTLGVCFFAMFACRTSNSIEEYKLTSSTSSTWVDRSVNVEQDSINPCNWSNEGRTIQCVFVERMTLKAWSAGLSIKGSEVYPELKTWQQAADHCKNMKSYGRVVNWRLPTISEAQAALLSPDGRYRRDSLIDLLESVQALGLWPMYSLIWTDTADPNDRLARFAVLRGPTSAPAAPSSVDRPKHWLCVADVKPDILRGEPMARSNSLNATDHAPELATSKATPIVSSKLIAKAGIPFRTCPVDYPGNQSSKFRIAAIHRQQITNALGIEVPKDAIGNFGQLILSAATGFAFADLSAAISSDTRDRLRSLIERYVDAVAAAVGPGFSIDYIVVGHASPSFNGSYLSPNKCSGNGSQVNQGFAADRAKTVADTLVSLRSGLSGHVEIKSVGHYYPITKAVDVRSSRCGPYDCDASKRVEIFFHASSVAASE